MQLGLPAAGSAVCLRIHNKIHDLGVNSVNIVMVVHSYHVTYAFQSESTLYSCLNVKEFLAQNRQEI